MLASTMQAQQTAPAPQPATQGTGVQAAAPQASAPVRLEMPKSHNPLNAYSPDYVPEPLLTNSPRLDRLVRKASSTSR